MMATAAFLDTGPDDGYVYAGDPDLLAALTRLLTLNDRVSHEDCYGYADVMQDNEAWDTARALIAKAAGATP